jgi:polysaccharide deacetylase family protein (PEP-CTERM system associated)
MPLALSVDVEEYFQVSNFERALPRARWPQLPSRVADATRRLLDLFDAHGARATFFALGWVARRHGALLREIAARGHEIASHGDAHEQVHRLGPAAFRQDLRRARAAIEDAVGRTPRGYRAPSFSITPRSRWALDVLADEGVELDSSVFPVRHPRYGWPGFPHHPVALELPSGVLREFPPTTLGVGRFRLPVAGGGYLRLLPFALFRPAFEAAARAAPAALLYVHPWEVDPGQPRVPASWRVRINHYRGLAQMERRLAALLRAHPAAPLGQVLDGLEAEGRLPRLAMGRRPGGARRGLAPAAVGA